MMVMTAKRIKILLTVLVLAVGVSTFILANQTRSSHKSGEPVKELKLANYLPASCLLYIQFSDLTNQIKAWQSSQLQSRYYQSKSFELWQRRHLSLKLTLRLDEFQTSLGQGLSLDNVPATAGHEAAIAIYDIGGTQFVFITELDTPTSLAATVLNPENFTEKSYKDQKYFTGTSGGSIQVCYALIGKKLIAATKEALLTETIDTINDRSPNLNSLPELRKLVAEAQQFHDITLWLDQSRINKDWYFRHYWIHKNFTELEPIRRGLVDLEIGDDRWIERRYFTLTDNSPAPVSIKSADIKRIAGAVPPQVAAFQIDSISAKDQLLIGMINELLFQQGGAIAEPPEQSAKSRYAYEGDSYDYNYSREYYDQSSDEFVDDNYYIYTNRTDDGRHYSYTNSIFNVEIDDPLLTGVAAKEQYQARVKGEADRAQEISDTLLATLYQARPFAIARFSEPNIEANDLFISFDHGALIALATPASFNRAAFEQALEQAVRFNLVTTSKPLQMEWQTSTVAGVELRSLSFPLIGRGVAYALKGDLLVLCNRSDYAQKVLGSNGTAPAIEQQQLTNYRIVRPALGRDAFLRLFKQLDGGDVELKAAANNSDSESAEESTEDSPQDKKDKLAEAFFSGNIGSLFNVTSNLSEVTFESQARPDSIQETVQYRLNTSPAKRNKKR